MGGSAALKQDVRILLVGEDGVGKTSLILSLIQDEFPERTPRRVEEVLIPADVTPERVPTHIVDYCAAEQSEQSLHDELRKASVVCIVYAVDAAHTVERITSYWLPAVQSAVGADSGKPIILVGNKSDVGDSATMDQIVPIMNEFPEIETCVECSAKTLKNISELFYYAQKAVLHPTAPLYVPEDRELTQACKKALSRVFKLCDGDNDGLLNDGELKSFQKLCFNVPLTAEAVREVKAVVRAGLPDGVLNDALTLTGFLHLHTLFVQRGRHETTWAVLRKFGNDNALQLANDYLYPRLTVPRGCATELSSDGFQFLVQLFEKFDEDKDDCLSPTELQNLFSVCPPQQWNTELANCTETNENGWLTHDGFLAYWALLARDDVTRAMEYLAYLGYNTRFPNQLSAVTVTRDRRIDWQERKTSRNVFQCHVIGSKGAGKTAFLQAYLGRTLQQQVAMNKQQMPSFVARQVDLRGQRKYLLMHEIDVDAPEDVLTSAEQNCDVVCLLYDVSNPASFAHCAQVYKRHFARTRVPCVVVGSKADRSDATQSAHMQPVEFCRVARLPAPLRFSAAAPADPELFEKLALFAACPHLKRAYDKMDLSACISSALAAVGVIAAVGSVYLFITRK